MVAILCWPHEIMKGSVVTPVFGAGFENNLSVGKVAQKIHCPDVVLSCPKF